MKRYDRTNEVKADKKLPFCKSQRVEGEWQSISVSLSENITSKIQNIPRTLRR